MTEPDLMVPKNRTSAKLNLSALKFRFNILLFMNDTQPGRIASKLLKHIYDARGCATFQDKSGSKVCTGSAMNRSATNKPPGLQTLFDRWTSAICQTGDDQANFFHHLVNILDHLREAVLLADKKAGIVYHNPVSLALHGFQSQDQAQLPSGRFLDLYEFSTLTGRLLQPQEWPLHRALRGERFSDFEVIARNAETGQQFIGSYGATPLLDTHTVLITIRETTDQKRANAELKAADRQKKLTTQELDASEKRLRIATRASRLGVFEWDMAADRSVWENQHMFEIFGYEPDSPPPGKSEFFEQIVHPEDRNALASRLAAAMASGRTVSAQCRIRRRDGEIRWAEFVGQFEYGPDGEPTRMVGVAADITQRRLSEDALRLSHDDLHRMVVERTATLQHTIQKLRDLSLTSLEALEGDRNKVARDLHDGICGSLAGVKFGLEGISERLESSAPEAAQELDNLIAHLADTIKETKRAAANLRPLMIDELGLLRSIRRFAEQFGSQYKNIRVDTQINANEDDIPRELKIVVYRLLQEAIGNTAKHSEADSFRLRLKLDGNWVVLEMEDNGSGFTYRESPEPSDHLTGSGLRNMRQRVEVCGGSFELCSEGGKGTRIHVRLPILSA
jgi:two-component system sensor histidine kinase UhpB